MARKRNAADFVLWKPELDGVGWDAPFGRGRPGWHIECSAMAKATLTEGIEGDVIDIHCGGVDLKFPHHENEIAQSCCANDEAKFANYWVHNEFLNMGTEKMSKSLGNVTLVNDLLKDWDGEVIRLALLKAHYRSELNWSEDLLKESKAQLDGWYRLLQDVPFPDFDQSLIEGNLSEAFLEHETALKGYLFGDLNLPMLLSLFGSSVTELHYSAFTIDSDIEENSSEDVKVKARLFGYRKRVFFFAGIFGLLQKDPEEWFSGGISDADKALSLIHI